jgi:hypothetical protein
MKDTLHFLSKSFFYSIQILILSVLSFSFSIIFLVKLVILYKSNPAISSPLIFLFLAYFVNLIKFLVHKKHSRWLNEIINGGMYVKTEGKDN